MDHNHPPKKARIWLSRTFEAARPEIAHDLQTLGRQVFGHSFDFMIAEHIEAPDGAPADGAYDPTTRIAYIALQANDAAMTHTLWHEGVHHLRNAGAFTSFNGEPTVPWRTLEREAINTWRKRYDIDQRYDADAADIDPAAREAMMNEEAIAEALADYQTRGLQTGFNPTVRTALGHIMRFFRRVRNALRSRGFSTWEDVFEDITSGRAGARTDQTRRAELDRQLKTAWHASPHRFNEFTTTTIGAGEGAQAYGWGLYFAEKREIAEHYQNRFQAHRDIASTHPRAPLYRVDLAPAEDEYLLYDESIDAQSDKVKEALQRMYPKWRAPGEYERLRRLGVTGGGLITLLKDNGLLGHKFSAKRASRRMLSKGIRGIKYLDAASRGKEAERTYNYIIFDDADVTIEYVEFQRTKRHDKRFTPGITESNTIAGASDHELHLSVSPALEIQPMNANTDTETYAREASQLLELAVITADADNSSAAADKFREAREAVSLAVPAIHNELSANGSAHAALRQLYRANYPPNPAPSFSNASETYELQAHSVLQRAGNAAYKADRIETAEILYNAAHTTYVAMSSADQQAVADADRPYFINTNPTILSNDSHCPIRADGIEWSSVQHYFQAQKLGTVRGPEAEHLYESIRAAPTASEATRIGNTVPLVSGWEDLEVGVMAEALCSKFHPASDAAKALLETGDRPLVNNTPASIRPTGQAAEDSYWAQRPDNHGANALGKMLENCRDELQAGRPATIDALTTKIPTWPFHVGDPAPRRAWEYADALRRHTDVRRSWTQSYRHPNAHARESLSTRNAELGQSIARASHHFIANFERYGPHLAEVHIGHADLETRQRTQSAQTSHTRTHTQEHAMGAMQL